MMATFLVAFNFAIFLLLPPIDSFQPRGYRAFLPPKPSCSFHVTNARYGPPIDDDDPIDPRRQSSSSSSTSSSGTVEQKDRMKDLLERVMEAPDPTHIPSMLTKDVELILSSLSTVRFDTEKNATSSQLDLILQEVAEEESEEVVRRMSEAAELVVSFAESFVDEAAAMEDHNRKLLGKIIRTLSDKTVRNREEALDELMEVEKERFTPGFLRHLEGECGRIAGAPGMSPESSRLLEIMRMIQTRVLEELAARDLGEAAQVLGQLVGYEKKSERLAVLEAGLQVRGTAFAHELQRLTKEALEGFQQVPDKADPGLVECVEQVDERLRRFLKEEASFE
jgi:hypothetical protein